MLNVSVDIVLISIVEVGDAEHARDSDERGRRVEKQNNVSR